MIEPLHPLESAQIDVELQLYGVLAERLIEHAERLGKDPAILLSELIERVLLDDLIDLVLASSN